MLDEPRQDAAAAVAAWQLGHWHLGRELPLITLEYPCDAPIPTIFFKETREKSKDLQPYQSDFIPLGFLLRGAGGSCLIGIE